MTSTTCKILFAIRLWGYTMGMGIVVEEFVAFMVRLHYAFPNLVPLVLLTNTYAHPDDIAMAATPVGAWLHIQVLWMKFNRFFDGPMYAREVPFKLPVFAINKVLGAWQVHVLRRRVFQQKVTPAPRWQDDDDFSDWTD